LWEERAVQPSPRKAGRDVRPLDSSVVPRYASIATFMRAPSGVDLDVVDVGVFGVPTDQGLSSRTGTRHGPAAVREASRLIRAFNPSSRVSPFDAVNVTDVGDVDVHVYDLGETIARTTALVRRLREAGVAPLAIGGDHVVTLSVLRGLFDGAPFGLLQFDSHPDTNDVFYGSRENHATAIRRLHEEGVLDAARVVQLGLRGTQFSADDAAYGRAAGFTVITMDDYEAMGRAAAIDRIRSVLAGGPVYVTVDVDGLDPADAPGTAALEPGGLRMRDCQVIIRGLAGLDVRGADVCEVAPQLDPTGVTAVNAANLMFELLCVMAAVPR
jgi:guanidinopropionase